MRTVFERRNGMTGTTVRLNDFRDDPEFGDPENPWALACREHQEGDTFPTRTEAEKLASSPPDWCRGCEDEWTRRTLAEEEQEEEADVRSDFGALAITTTRLSCGCTFGPSEVLKAIESIEVGLFRVCPKHRRAELVEKIVREFVFREERVDVEEALRKNRRPKLVRPAKIDRRLHGEDH